MTKHMSLIFLTAFLMNTACYPGPDAQVGGQERDTDPCAGFAQKLVYQGDFAVQNVADLQALENIVCISGDLTFEDTDLNEISSLDSLQVIGGSLLVENNAQLASLHFPGLEFVHRSLSLSANPLIRVSDFPLLKSVGGFFEITDNALLEQLNCAKLQTADALKIHQNERLVQISFSELDWLGVLLQISNNPALPTAAFVLTHAGYLVVLNNDKLARLQLQDMENIWDLEIGSNPVLTDLALDRLENVGQNFSVHDNLSLPDCLVDNLRDQLQAAGGIGGELDIIDNGGSACAAVTCNAGESCVQDCTIPEYFSCE